MERREAAAEERFAIWQEASNEAAAERTALFTKEMDLRKKEHELAEREKSLGIVLAGPAITGSARANILLDKLAARTGWDGKKMDRTSHSVKQEAERLRKIISQTRSARTALGKVLEEFKDILTPDESTKIAAARGAIYDLTEAAQVAKEQGERLARQREDEEKAIAKLASQAVKQAFEDVIVDLHGQLLVAAWEGGSRSYSNFSDFVRESRISGPGQWEYDRYLKACLDNPTGGAASRVEQSLKSSADVQLAADLAATERAKFNEVRPDLEQKWGGLIERTQAALVAQRLAKAC